MARVKRGLSIAGIVMTSAVGLAACGGSDNQVPSTAAGASAGPAVAVEGPGSGPVTGDSIRVNVTASGYTLNCGVAGRPVASGVGHYHIALDGRLVNAFCDPSPSVSLQNVEPGPHKLTVVPAGNDHSEVKEAAQTIDFDYAPATPKAAITAKKWPGPAAVEIVSPKNGDTVSGQMTLKVRVKNFGLSGDLFGKLPVAGYGHWHVHLDKPELGTMMAMGSGNSMPISLEGITPGKHTFIVMLADNIHRPIQPMTMAQVTVNVK